MHNGRSDRFIRRSKIHHSLAGTGNTGETGSISNCRLDGDEPESAFWM